MSCLADNVLRTFPNVEPRIETEVHGVKIFLEPIEGVSQRTVDSHKHQGDFLQCAG